MSSGGAHQTASTTAPAEETSRAFASENIEKIIHATKSILVLLKKLHRNL